ncbi:MAG TPA: carbamoyltransferase HypF [Synergistales bacterium]|nr:carbamoyltransferase HypF [Synergistales bacterium]MDI9392070.1 carbamoyltransferase HypF [Synergistota bacterium]HPQ78675.1 carbamoyltransferase HypF [Synergistales bacterium]
MIRHVRLQVTGVVQGIGFRPFCSRLSGEIGLGGSVRNTTAGVVIDLYGDPEGIDSYIERLQTDCPTLGHIQSITIVLDERIDDIRKRPFEILDSHGSGGEYALIPPDIATCSDCLAELRDPGNRRFRYPFINCTNCGPRFTIIEGLPYDRPLTSMSGFPLCGECSLEYSDPDDRRFHAQPVACEKCGPCLSLASREGSLLAQGEEALLEAIRSLTSGGIVALKGLGGFHIACLPQDLPVLELRKRKKRPAKPFALMARNEKAAESIVKLSHFSRQILNSPRRPIVICPRRSLSGVSDHVAPYQNSLGIMLPYTPIHHLIMEEIPLLVMTSANLSDEPLISENGEVIEKLKGIADLFLVHDRPIIMKIDDTVIAPSGKRTILVRRGRGYVPHPIMVRRDMPRVLAAGAEMRSTFSLGRGRTILPGQYIGDLKQLDTAVYYEKALRHFIRLFGLRPNLLAADLHPSYACTDIAQKVMGKPEDTLLVQHHHAHMAACLVENGHEGTVLGIILDGTGLGSDRNIWGGEFLLGDISSFTRVGHFREAPLPGGDRAVLEPWRFALALMEKALGPGDAERLAGEIWPTHSHLFGSILSTLDKAPVTSSCGRLFDAVAAVLGIRDVISYEGQAAMELESSARGGSRPAPFGIREQNGKMILDWEPAVRWILLEGLRLGAARTSSAFHFGLAEAISDIALEISRRTGVRETVLSGGVWQNRRLLSLAIPLLERRGLRPLIHHALSPNDECISVGQAAVASVHWGGRTTT